MYILGVFLLLTLLPDLIHYSIRWMYTEPSFPSPAREDQVAFIRSTPVQLLLASPPMQLSPLYGPENIPAGWYPRPCNNRCQGGMPIDVALYGLFSDD